MEPELTIAQAAANIANAARIYVQYTGRTPDEALDVAAQEAADEALAAHQRTGYWATTHTTQQIDAAGFQGAVAKDILLGTVERPSTGNVRAYALALVMAS